jgi:hypothetical protein
LAINKMLASVWPRADHDISLDMARALWRYSGVKPEAAADAPAPVGGLVVRPVRLLYTTRHSKRVFSDELDARIIALLSSIPEVELVIADFSEFPFVEQVQRISRTDILFGLHGSGLTHLFWLPPGATVVEIMPENTLALDYRLFAGIRGVDYVGT